MPHINPKPVAPSFTLPKQISEEELSTPSAPQSSFAFSDIFESELQPSPIISTSFDIEEAREICDDEACLQVMQEIAEKNKTPRAKDNICYTFEREPRQYSLNEALRALVLIRTIRINCSADFFQTPPRTQELSSPGDLIDFWNNEKLLDL